jgi:hypothetical protein
MADFYQLAYGASATNIFASLFYAEYQPSIHMLRYVNAGHNPPIVLRPQDGRFYGIENLRIADDSIMPRVTTGNTMAPCVVIGGRAAEFLRNEHQLETSSVSRSARVGISDPSDSSLVMNNTEGIGPKTRLGIQPTIGFAPEGFHNRLFKRQWNPNVCSRRAVGHLSPRTAWPR